jgi:hypothetical protein
VSKTTNGWYFCVEWKDGTTSWERMADLKESNPVEVAENTVAKSFLDAPDFVWWDPHVLKKRSMSIAAVTKSYHNHTHNFGIEVTKIWDDCVRLDKENENRISFKIMNGEKLVLPTYQEIRCHMIFDVKMEYFRRKAKFFAY